MANDEQTIEWKLRKLAESLNHNAQDFGWPVPEYTAGMKRGYQIAAERILHLVNGGRWPTWEER